MDCLHLISDVPGQAPECWSVAFGNAFNDEERCVLAGYANGDLRLGSLQSPPASTIPSVPASGCYHESYADNA